MVYLKFLHLLHYVFARYAVVDLLFWSQITYDVLAPVTFFSWKLIKRTRLVRPLEADLVWERPTIDAYEQTFIDPPNSFWNEMLGPLRRNKGSDRRASLSGNYSGVE